MSEVSPRLAPGHHLYVGGDAVWRCRTPGDTVLRISGADHLMAKLQKVLHGRAELAEVCSDDADRGVLLHLVESFARNRLIADSPPRPSRPSQSSAHSPTRHSPRVLVEGDNPVSSLVAEMLGGHFAVTAGPADGATIEHTDFVVSVAGWLPDAHWQEVDRLCGLRRIPFHHCHVEGTRFFIGPCSVSGTTARYSDARARRLAAADYPDELTEFWRYLDRGQLLPPVPWPPAGGAAVVAGILVADVLAHLSGQPQQSIGCQTELDVDSLTVIRHPVLPLPDLITGEA